MQSEGLYAWMAIHMSAKCQLLLFIVAIALLSFIYEIHLSTVDAHMTHRTHIHMDEISTIDYGEQVSVELEELSITFSSITEESRCPKDVSCIWEGNAKIIVVMQKKNHEPMSLELNTYSELPKEGTYLNYRIQLIRLDPHPTSTREIHATEYKASLILSKS